MLSITPIQQTGAGMSLYEKIAIFLSVIAIIIPIVQWAWKKWIVKGTVKFYPTGQATLFFNQSGSYIRLNGVLESERKASTIKKLSLVLTRKRDDQKLNLVWSFLISPVNQSMLGNYVQTMEAAHPFRVEADSVSCAFIEYGDPSDSSGKKIRKICNNLTPLVLQSVQAPTYNEAYAAFSQTTAFIDAKNSILSDFFWEIGKYTADITVEYNKKTSKTFAYEFTVSEQDSMELRNDIEESLMAALKEYYHVPHAFKAPLVEISERKA